MNHRTLPKPSYNSKIITQLQNHQITPTSSHISNITTHLQTTTHIQNHHTSPNHPCPKPSHISKPSEISKSRHIQIITDLKTFCFYDDDKAEAYNKQLHSNILSIICTCTHNTSKTLIVSDVSSTGIVHPRRLLGPV